MNKKNESALATLTVIVIAWLLAFGVVLSIALPIKAVLEKF